MPIKPVVLASSGFEPEPESMQPNTIPGKLDDVNRKLSVAKLPSTEVASA